VLVAFDQTNDSVSCPANWGAQGIKDWDSSITYTADSCSCACTNETEAYCTGTWGDTEFSSSQSTCPSPSYSHKLNFDTQGNPTLVQDCETFSGTVTDNDYYYGHATSLSTAAGTCKATVTKTAGSLSYDTGKTCGISAAGAGCASGNECVPVGASGFLLCSMVDDSANTVTCGSLTKYDIYTGVSDTRDCSGCTCDGTTDLSCNATNMTYSQTDNCNGATNGCSPVSGPTPFEYAADTCQGVGSNGGTMKSYCVRVTHSGTPDACSKNPDTSPVGSVTGSGHYTICCQ
jgi:hypothetical protein